MSEPRITMAHCAGASHGGNGAITTVLLHDEEYPLSLSSAENIAGFFSKAAPPRDYGCVQYVIDGDSEQHCVADNQLSYNAPPNGGTIGIERDGYASWNLDQWNQAGAQRTTCRVIARTAELCVRHGLPALWVTAAGQRAGQRGVSDHRSRSVAFGQSSHTDPGPAFPREAFMARLLTAVSWVQNAAQFQAAHGLTPDGDVGPSTINAMADALYGAPVGGVPVPGTSTSAPAAYSDEPATGVLSQWMKGPRVKALQAALGVAADGYFGIDTTAAVRQFQAAHGLTVDGLVGPATLGALSPAPPVSPPAPASGLAVDGTFGPVTIARLQTYLGVAADGQFGPASKAALQRWLGVGADGVVGSLTIRALQRAVGAATDGVWGADTTSRLQAFLNGH